MYEIWSEKRDKGQGQRPDFEQNKQGVLCIAEVGNLRPAGLMQPDETFDAVCEIFCC